MNYRKFRKNAKALSPVVASIILIAVTVAVSVVVAAWMGGMTIGLMGNAEQVAITNVEFGTTNVNATVRNTGGASVTIQTATIDGKSANLAATGNKADGITPNTNVISKGESGAFIVTPTTAIIFQDGAQYQIKLTTAKGNTIVYTATYSIS
jgi:flagellin-like protein